MTNIYVGNLPFSTSEDEVRNLFSAYGAVDNVSLISDRETGRLRGFGFVEMSSGGDEAIAALNQTELGGRRLVVNLAKPARNEDRGVGSPEQPLSDWNVFVRHVVSVLFCS